MIMTINNDYETKTYNYFDLRVDIVTHTNEFNYRQCEAFLYHKDYGVKDLMWGSEIGHPNGCSCYDEFLEMVSANIDDYIDSYKEEYMGY